MVDRAPFAMIPREQNRFLRFFESSGKVGVCRIQVMGEVAPLRFTIDSTDINAVARTDLIFYLCGKLGLLQGIVWTLARVRMIKCGEGILERPECAVLRGGFNPGSAAQVFGGRSKAESIVLEQARVLLLGNTLGQ